MGGNFWDHILFYSTLQVFAYNYREIPAKSIRMDSRESNQQPSNMSAGLLLFCHY
jgi:hypothetical protein